MDESMPKKEPDRFAPLAANIGSPRVVTDIARAIAENRRELDELLDLQKIALKRHSTLAEPQKDVIEKATEQPSPQPEPAPVRGLDGTMGSLVEVYKADSRSGFNSASHATRGNYNSILKRIADDYSERRLADLQEKDIRQFHDKWKAGGAAAMAYSLITMLRMMFAFGMNKLEDRECARLSTVLHHMKFERLKSRLERLTKQHVLAFREKAHALGFRSIALAQAIQFECALRQRDVLGEWIPQSEVNGPVYVLRGKAWIRGLRWEEIDNDRVLHRGDFHLDLKLSPMVMDELNAQYPGGLPKEGAMIMAEGTKMPWVPFEFRRRWRQIAEAAGIPNTIQNRDSRPLKSGRAVKKDSEQVLH